MALLIVPVWPLPELSLAVVPAASSNFHQVDGAASVTETVALTDPLAAVTVTVPQAVEALYRPLEEISRRCWPSRSAPAAD